jgi:predicted metal-binding membrane protein
MNKAADHSLDHLPPLQALMGRVAARPKALALACVVTLAAAGWIYLGTMVARVPGEALGPGMVVLDFLPRVIDDLCRPFSGGANTGAAGLAASLAMWSAMALAMMLPSASPMLLTYAEIADTAAGKGERVVSPLVIAAGYVAAWLAFALVATLAQWLLARTALLDKASHAVALPLAGVILIGAGFYQFSPLKQACLRLCRNPFSFFFTNWETTPRGVFRLGLRQGSYCIGCCWALMLVMFAVGLMNVLWMAALGIVMTIEKMTATPRFSQGIGVALAAAGAAVMVSAFVT